MSKRFTKLIAAFAATMAMLPASAQVMPVENVPLVPSRILPGQKSAQQKVDPLKAFPTLLAKTLPRDVNSPFSSPDLAIRPTAPKYLVTVNPDLTMWGNLLTNSFMGMYAFHPVANLNFELLSDYKKGYFNGGSGMIDGVLHGIYLDTSYAPYGILLLSHYAFDTETWQLEEQPKSVRDYSLIATETATDPTTGEVFGEFYTADLKKFEWGVIDYTTLTRTTIAPAQHSYVALGIANDGFAYGVSKEGDFYQIDRSTGAETKKGSTGIEITDSEDRYYAQSGEFDARTNEFFWASTDKDGKFQLYTVNLNDGHVTPVGGYTEPAMLVALNFPPVATAAGAPAAASDLKADFAGGASSGKVSFKAPDKKYDGSSLTGNVSYKVFANGKEVADGAAEAGKKVEANVTVSEGVVNFIVFCSNDAGKGPRVRLTTYVGYDVPDVVGNLAMDLDETGKATVTWEAPKEGLHKGYMGPLTYDVFRNVGEESTKVAEGISATSFSEVVPKGKLSAYSYSVQAINGPKRSAIATSDGKIFGNALEVPFFDDFPTAASFKLYTVIDVNEDKSTWGWNSSKGGSCAYRYNKKNDADDWLISPPIQMKQGKAYNVSFKAAAGLSMFPERLEVKWGNDKTVEAMEKEILPATDIASVKYQEFTKRIEPAADGNYYIGFHAISKANEFRLTLDSLSVEVAAEAKAPAMVDNLTAAADPTAALKATLKFNAPTKAVDGSALTDLTKIVVSCGERVVKTITAPAPGSAQEAVDENAVNGENAYTVVAYNAHDFGLKASVKVYVGQDVPVLGKIKTTDQTTAVKLGWEVPTGVHKGVILPAEVTYNIHSVTDEGKLGDKLGSVKGSTGYTVSDLNTNEGKQKYQHWAVNAENVAGTSGWAAGALIVGAPYTLPFHNSFKDGTVEEKFVGLERTSGKTSWALTNDVSSDDDNGSLIFLPTKPGVSTIVMGKTTLRGASNPRLIFDYRGDGEAKEKVEMRFQKKNGEVTEPVWINAGVANDGKWKNYIVNIPAELANEEYVLLRVVGIADEISEDAVYVDNINIADPYQKDAGVELTAPESLKKGQTAKFSVKVTNLGLDKLEKAKVALTVNDKVVKEETLGKSLSFMQNSVLSVDYKTTSMDASDKLSVKATVNLDGDLEPDNNEATADVSLETPDVKAPQNLRGEKSGSATAVKLAWDAPATTITSVTDDFESYKAWGTSFGDWTTVDNDHGRAGSLTQGTQYQHQGEEFAFLNWQPSDLFKSGQGLDPHSGTKAAVAIYQIDESGKNFVDADNWLISPQLSGKAQTVSFWVNNLKATDGSGAESFDVLSSTSGSDPDSFVKIGETHVQDAAQWTEVKVDVPEGTKYFAIHHITSKDKAFIFMIDDAKFEAGSGPVSYNIYRDGELIGSTSKLVSDDLKAPDNKEHKYCVTAVYADGSESAPAEISVATAIQRINADGETVYDVYTIDGKQIMKGAKSLHPLAKGVYIINGQKTVVK
ncbi:choice-of-anchor J domain-containing protein [Prevotella multiformis]|uniref:choice-of-anchor J domain-containing protein n=1 Tax=Prevotella multiformis TaxID=282402 RepID=UPI0023EF8A29|nr:choice-of-anchor J domain-containing protein [Prevotella multiformis]